MAGDWIKMRGNLWDDPRVARICDLTDSTEGPVIGALYWLWATADQHSEDGAMPGLTLRQIDRKTGLAGFAAALCDVGWLNDDPQGVVIQKFEEHNGTSAKRRCTDAQRKANSRSLSASDADTDRTDEGQKSPDLGAREREEKRREEELSEEANASSSSPGGDKAGKPDPFKAPPCPYDAIVIAYTEALTELPRVKLMDDKRKKAMREFWVWIFRTPRSDGQARASNAVEAMTWVEAYFERAGKNDFLMGRRPSRDHPGWKADFDFLLTDRGRKHVIERSDQYLETH